MRGGLERCWSDRDRLMSGMLLNPLDGGLVGERLGG